MTTFFSTTLQVSRRLLRGGEYTRRLDNVVRAGVGPGDISGIFLHVELDLLAVNNQGIFLDLNCALEPSVLTVILEHVGSVLWLNEWIIDGDNVDFIVLDSISEDNSANTTEAVDADVGRHFNSCS